jgi:hypothetical protein
MTEAPQDWQISTIQQGITDGDLLWMALGDAGATLSTFYRWLVMGWRGADPMTERLYGQTMAAIEATGLVSTRPDEDPIPVVAWFIREQGRILTDSIGCTRQETRKLAESLGLGAHL